jgi:hypothetical protein
MGCICLSDERGKRRVSCVHGRLWNCRIGSMNLLGAKHCVGSLTALEEVGA